ncbi:MAG: hypothetical protein M3Y50_17540 [Acidobacteriota bacterium]|nr:hypothetical protein [Acidobacteriota bacterium]
MPVPQQSIPHRGTRLLRLIAPSLLLVLAVALPAHAVDQPRRIPLDPLGFQPLSPQFLLAGSSMLTLHYVDDTHLLLTFNVRRLMHRLPDEPEDDQDRNIDAILLELPTGRVLARTSWRTHDRSQYLWSIGHGRFLLRIRDTVTALAPLANLHSDEPFREHPFLNTQGRRIAEISVSPDNRLLTVETVKRTPPAPRPKTPLFGPTPPAPPEPLTLVQINFYRLPESSEPSEAGETVRTVENLRPQSAGVLHTHTIGTIAALSGGYIAVLEQGRQHWAFDFDAYSGKKIELAAFDSVCRPSPFFVSRSEFIAFGCRTGTNRQLLGGFNLRGEQTWQQNLFGDYTSPSLVFAPARDRFAFGRVLLHTAATPEQPLLPEELGAQPVIVFQAGSGRQILHAECSPAEPAGQNFALSPDGLSLALIRDNAIQIYSLPDLTPKEASDVKTVATSAPEDTTLPVNFQIEQRSLAAESASDAEADFTASDTKAPENAAPNSLTPVATVPAPSLPRPTEPTPSASSSEGDPSPNQPRKPPTLYTLPTDPPRSPENSEPK